MKEESKCAGNVRSTAEIELQPKTRDLKVSRNSWAEIYKETTALRKHKKLLGQESTFHFYGVHKYESGYYEHIHESIKRRERMGGLCNINTPVAQS